MDTAFAKDILQENFYEGRRELFANLKDIQNFIGDKWHLVNEQTPTDSQKSSCSVKGV